MLGPEEEVELVEETEEGEPATGKKPRRKTEEVSVAEARGP